MALIQEQQHLQTMRQEQTLTQQQIQALEMLASPILDLQTMISQELEKNPILEAEDDKDDSEMPMEESTPTDPDNDNQEWVEQLLKLDDMSPYQRSTSHYVSPEEEERRQHYLDSISIKDSLTEKLEEQLRFLNISKTTYSICELLIAGLDDDCYLRSHPADIAMASGEDMESIMDALLILQSCEPAGIAARNLKERLLLQLERDNKQDTLTYIAIRDHLNHIASNKIIVVAKALGISIEKMKEVIESIHKLTPHLNPEHGEDPKEYIAEEVTVIEKSNGELDVILNNEKLPRLRISSYYKQLLSDPSTTKDTKVYIREKIRGAAFLISSLTQRQSTLERIAREIVKVQEGFFRYGMKEMKPLTMAQIADRIGVHETTVSRGVSGKYLRCKHGLMPLKKFFTTGYEDSAGKTISNLVVKDTIKELIDKEDRSKPFSDSQISEILAQNGLKVARRTVAKYRESLSILSSSLRRKFW